MRSIRELLLVRVSADFRGDKLRKAVRDSLEEFLRSESFISVNELNKVIGELFNEKKIGVAKYKYGGEKPIPSSFYQYTANNLLIQGSRKIQFGKIRDTLDEIVRDNIPSPYKELNPTINYLGNNWKYGIFYSDIKKVKQSLQKLFDKRKAKFDFGLSCKVSFAEKA